MVEDRGPRFSSGGSPPADIVYPPAMSDQAVADALAELAGRNLDERIAGNPYPGRGIVVGRLAGGDWLMLYWIMGRSANSRNRRFLVEPNGALRTAALRPEELEDPTNVIYRAMCELPAAGRGAGPEALAAMPEVFITANGDHADTLAEIISSGGTVQDALNAREREDDPPHYTPRIAAVLDQRGAPHGVALELSLAIIRARSFDPSTSDRILWHFPPPPPGYGYCIHTYTNDGTPLPPFQGDPFLVSLPASAEEAADAYWQALDADNRIALAAKQINPREQSTIVLRGSGA